MSSRFEPLTKRSRMMAAERSGRSSGGTLAQAAAAGDVADVARLIDGGADPCAREPDGWQPIHHAAFHGHAPVVERLLRAGVSPDAIDREGMRPLHYAALRGHGATVMALAAGGAAIDAVGEVGERTPLATAAEMLGYGAEAARALVALGADVDRGDRDGVTPLMSACEAGDEVLIGLLLAAGADPDRLDFRGDSAWDRFVARGRAAHGFVPGMLRPSTVARARQRTLRGRRALRESIMPGVALSAIAWASPALGLALAGLGLAAAVALQALRQGAARRLERELLAGGARMPARAGKGLPSRAPSVGGRRESAHDAVTRDAA